VEFGFSSAESTEAWKAMRSALSHASYGSGATVRLFEETGHHTYVLCPERYIAALAEFLDQDD
jgi:pimeloyl-ACP methyl ester carboxylesterase